MNGGDCARPVAVARFGECGSGVARAALRRNWTIRDADEPGFVRWAVSNGVRVLIVQLDDGVERALGMVERLSRHWNPVLCVVVGPVSAVNGAEVERTARRAGAAAYVPASAGVDEIEKLATALAA
jgi:hypothetical protein